MWCQGLGTGVEYQYWVVSSWGFYVQLACGKLVREAEASDRIEYAGARYGGMMSITRDNPTVEENRNAGTPEWQLRNVRFDDPVTLASFPLVRHLTSSAIQGYASKTSVYPGETIDLMVSMEPEGKYTIDFYRLGWYGGLGGRHMGQMGPYQGRTQPVPAMGMQRVRECTWEVSARLTVPDDWESGVYLAKLSRAENAPYGVQSYITFVVKSRRNADLLFQVSDITWQAYNKWPGNDSIYTDGTPNVWYQGTEVRASFDRPYAKYCQVLDAPLSLGSGEFLLWEHPMAFWLEEQGYDVAYCSNMDLHLDPQVLDRCKAFLSVGHDEYWSSEDVRQHAGGAGCGDEHRILLGELGVLGDRVSRKRGWGRAVPGVLSEAAFRRRRGAADGGEELRARLWRLDGYEPAALDI